MRKNRQQLSKQFTDAFGVDLEDKKLQYFLLMEEFIELGQALGLEWNEVSYQFRLQMQDKQLQFHQKFREADTLDALVDMEYIANHIKNACKFSPRLYDNAFRAVHAANMAKLQDGKVIRNEHGKVMKPEGWKPVDLRMLIAEERG